MRIAIIGRHASLLNSIERLIFAGHTIECILTAPAPSDYAVGQDEFESYARARSIPCYVANRITADVDRLLGRHSCDVAISVNFPTVIGKSTIDLFPLGILNAHGGDLPRYRGNACQAWAMINGERQIGLCVHKMVAGELDSGDVLAKDVLPIDVNTVIADVFAWIEQRVPELFVNALSALSSDKAFTLYRQIDAGTPLRCFPRTAADARVDWKLSAPQVVRHINASGPPYEGAFFDYQGERLRVFRATWIQADPYLAVPGQIAFRHGNGAVDIACGGNGFCRIAEVARVGGSVVAPTALVKSVRHRFE
ncbi:formyltransferase family protein [Achromobacter mucicolens]|uniref:methionyl-tRNA formyltransferase n=1 Tax=Achromobacter mucicolens TaxID=1389922 RepID=UPI0024475ABF|nr:formyltransferase family protein [Achromobacter mucicolens]MDH0089858.1 formyltransferase family protein [Achromobacter mucicolens]